MAWTDDRIEKLKKLWEKGLSASQIAGELGEGVTRNAVIGKAHRLGLKSRPSPVKSAPKREGVKRVAPQTKKTPPKPLRMDEKPSKHRLSLLELNERVCKWPIGHPGDENFHFCGEPSVPALPYCEPHCLDAFQTQTSKKGKG